MSDTDTVTETNFIDLAAELTIAWLSNPSVRVNAEDVPAFLAQMHATMKGLEGVGAPADAAPEGKTYEGAVSSRKSLASPDHIISMIDGKPYKTLKRHIARHGMTPSDYRERYGLKPDYPMVSPSYSEARKAMALGIGLGRKPKSEGETPAAPKPRAPRKSAKDAAKEHLDTAE